MYTKLSDSLGTEKLTIVAGAATVGRPTGVNGKKMTPRRARVTSKELEKLNTKGLKAGGPGSGRHAETLAKAGFKLKGTDSDGRSTYTHPVKGKVKVDKDGSWDHSTSSKSKYTEGAGTTGTGLKNHLKMNDLQHSSDPKDQALYKKMLKQFR